MPILGPMASLVNSLFTNVSSLMTNPIEVNSTIKISRIDARVAMPTDKIFLIALHSPIIRAQLTPHIINICFLLSFARWTRSAIIAQQPSFCEKNTFLRRIAANSAKMPALGELYHNTWMHNRHRDFLVAKCRSGKTRKACQSPKTTIE